jgi:hypothetical protein
MEHETTQRRGSRASATGDDKAGARGTPEREPTRTRVTGTASDAATSARTSRGVSEGATRTSMVRPSGVFKT